MFAHLHCRSHFSFLEGASPVAALVEQAARGEVRHLALTDRAGVYAAVNFCRLAEAAGIHPVTGAELPVADGRRVAVLVRDDEGYAALCRELTAHHLDPDFQWLPALERLAERNWLLVACPALLDQILGRFRSPHLVAELVQHGRPDDRHRIRRLLATARQHGLMVCASNDVAFAEPDDHAVHRLLTAIRRRSTLGKLTPADTAPAEAWLKPARRMRELFTEIPEAVTNTVKIAESCQFRFTTEGALYPPFPVPEGETAYSLLWKKAFAGAARRYRPLRREVIRRLEHELDVICRMGYAEYFLIVRDVVEFAEREGIPAVGRGSAAGSLTAHALGITHVDPLALGLSFERFLNDQRTDPPDIDIDFCWRRRHDVIRYLYDTYGQENSAMLATFVTMAGRLCLRETARALGLPEAEISRFTRHIPHHRGEHMERVLRDIPECRNIPFAAEPYRSIIRLAKRIAGFPRHLGLHPCGIVLSRVPLHRVVPLQMTATGFAATQFDMREAEDVGLLKIDILGQRSLTVISDTLAAVRQNHAVELDFSRAPAGDAPTWHNIQQGRTIGCFQIESPGMRSLLRKLVPRDMDTIIAASSVIRPGPADAGMLREFIGRYHGTRPITYLHPAMETLLGSTLGVMVYQEDILRVAHAIAGITPGEADKLRRAMSSKRSAEAMQAMKATFIARAEGRRVPADIAREIWRQMESFSGYAFCKAHSSSYAVLSWQAAYLKTHFPAEFFAAVISNGGGFYSRAAYVLEARRWGVPVRLPDINRSDYFCVAEDAAVRLGLGLVGKLARNTADRILAARRQRLFTSFTDFLHRAAPDRDETEALIRCGALDGFEFSRPELLWRLELLFEPVRRARANPAAVGLPFPELAEPLFPPVILPRLPDFTPAEKLRQEAEILEVFVSDHPLALHRPELARLDLTRAADLPRRKDRTVRLAGWPVTSRRVFARNKQYMKFLTLEDETDIFEAVLFPAAYRRWGHFTTQPGPFVVEGTVTEEFNSFAVDVRRLIPLRHFGPVHDGAPKDAAPAEPVVKLPRPPMSD